MGRCRVDPASVIMPQPRGTVNHASLAMATKCVRSRACAEHGGLVEGNADSRGLRDRGYEACATAATKLSRD